MQKIVQDLMLIFWILVKEYEVKRKDPCPLANQKSKALATEDHKGRK